MVHKKCRKDIKILFIIPRYAITNKINYNYMFPIGLGYIYSTLKNNNYNIACLNLNHCNGTISDILKKEMEKNYDIVCTGHIGSIGYLITKEIIDSIRKHRSKSKIILGGALITSEPMLMFESLKPDFGVIGEGEKTILELLDSMQNKKNLRKVRGIIYKDNNKIIITEKREPILDINSVPSPDFEDMGFEEYLNQLYPNQDFCNNFFDYPRTYPILCSRSCPFQCTFCYHSIGNRYRERSVDDIIKELEAAVKIYNINTIAIYDDMLSYKKERLYELCKRIKELSKNIFQDIKWTCQLSVVNIDEDLLKTLKDSGCELISYGFESFSQEVLKSMKKPITPKQIDFAFKETLKAKISVQANFIFGDVAETKETARETLDYWKKNSNGQISLVFIQPYPCSEIYHHCIKKGIIKDRLEFIKNSTGNLVLNMTDKMTDEEVNELSNEIKKLEATYKRFATPIKVKNMKGKRYEVHVDCPFCNQRLIYKNYYLQGRLLYRAYIICRKCNMRFYISSPLIKLLKDYYFLTPYLEDYARRIRKNFNLLRI